MTFDVQKSELGLSLTMSSQNSLVHRCLQEIRRRFKEMGYSELAVLNLAVVTRELLQNAISHGNRNAVENLVFCSVTRTEESHILIEVEDEGDGFDYRTIDPRLPDDPRHIVHRGYKLVYAICERVEFNAKGNRVLAAISRTQDWAG